MIVGSIDSTTIHTLTISVKGVHCSTMFMGMRREVIMFEIGKLQDLEYTAN